MSFICFHVIRDHDKRPAQKELSVTLDKISNIKQTNVLQITYNQFHAPINPLSSSWEDTHLHRNWFEAFVNTSWEWYKGALSNSSKERGKALQKLKICHNAMLLLLVQQFLCLRTATHFPLSLPTAQNGCKHQHCFIFHYSANRQLLYL